MKILVNSSENRNALVSCAHYTYILFWLSADARQATEWLPNNHLSSALAVLWPDWAQLSRPHGGSPVQVQADGNWG